MTVTRDVIFDLLPAYFSGDASGDTRVLVEEFLATDPDMKKMADRFGRLRPAGAAPLPGEAEREKLAFARTRSRTKLRMAALGWALAAVFGFVMAMITSAGGRWGWAHPGLIIGVVFTASALVMWLMSFSAHPERLYAAFIGREKDRRQV